MIPLKKRLLQRNWVHEQEWRRWRETKRIGGEWSTRYLVQYKGGALCRWARFHVCYEKGFLHEGDIIGENTVHIGWISEGAQVDNFQTSLFFFTTELSNFDKRWSAGPPRRIWTRQGPIFYPNFWPVVSYKCIETQNLGKAQALPAVAALYN